MSFGIKINNKILYKANLNKISRNCSDFEKILRYHIFLDIISYISY